MSNVDISPEAVRKMHKRLGSTPFPDYLEEIVSDADMMIAALLSRIAELKAQKWYMQHTDTVNALVQMGLARDAAAERAKTARNDALREAAEAIAQTEYKTAAPAILCLIKEPTK